MDPTFRLRTATRLHFMLLRRYGQHIDVGLLLKCRDRLHDGLWLCEATGDPELIRLARTLAEANRQHEEAETVAHLRDVATAVYPGTIEGPQDMPWDLDSTIFGMTLPQDLPAPPRYPAPRSARWFNPVRWLRVGRQRQFA